MRPLYKMELINSQESKAMYQDYCLRQNMISFIIKVIHRQKREALQSVFECILTTLEPSCNVQHRQQTAVFSIT